MTKGRAILAQRWSGVAAHADARLRRIVAPHGIEHIDGNEVKSPSISSFLSPLPFLLLYGGLMGSWGMWDTATPSAEQWIQVVFSAVKVPLLIGTTFLLSLPCIVVLYTLAGLGADFRRILILLAETQTVFAFSLLCFSPFTMLFYGSSANYTGAVLFNALIFCLAALVGHVVLRRRYKEMEMRHIRHRLLLRLWFLCYAFVGIQAGWLLRPFVGVRGITPEFIRQDGWGNAYVEIATMLLNAIT